MTTPARPITVLLADDHPIFRKGLLDTIQSDPALAVIHETGDGEQALRLIRELEPDVAVLDVHMPSLNGLQVARGLAQSNSPTRVVVLTMYDDEETFTEAMNLGVKGYILKESAVLDVLNGIKAAAANRHFISPALSDHLLQRNSRIRELQEQIPGLQALTPAERRILKMVSEDKTSKEIAAELGISPRTVETHRLHICEKLQLHGAHSLLKFAFDHKGEL